MENENPWERKKTNPGIDQLLEDLKTMVVGKKGGKKPPKKNGSNKPPFSPNLNSRKIFLFVIPVLVAVLLFKSFYQVQPGEKGIVLRLGKYSKTTSSGLNFLIPFAEKVIVVDIETIRKEEFGFRSNPAGGNVEAARSTRTLDAESLMLTGDRNVINLNWVVQYKVNQPRDFVFNIRDGRSAVRDLSEMVIRRLVGNRDFDYLLQQREEIAFEALEEIQGKLNFYKSGVDLVTVQLQDVTPPTPVRPSFNEVNEADQDRTRLVNEAQKTYNEQIPKARGEAKKVLEEAEGYAIQRVNNALGDSSRFLAVLREYERYRTVTRTRLYIETMKEILPRVQEVIVLDKNKQVFPLYNLNK